MPAAFIFNHNFNDSCDASETDAQFASLPADPFDRNTYVGAINYLVREIIKVNPRAKIGFVSHYENQKYPRYSAADEVIAKYWQYPILRLHELTGFSQRRVPGSQALWTQPPYNAFSPRPGESSSEDMTMLRHLTVDEVHLHTDPTGYVGDTVSMHCATWLRQIL